MHNLENKIADWRKQLAAAGIKSPAILDELDSHLRDDLEQQIRSGTNTEQAFKTAVERIGQSTLLKAEFAKLGGFHEARQGKLIGIALCVLAAAFSLLWAPRFLTIHEMATGQRLLGLAAIVVTLLAALSWRFSYKYLPVIRDRPLRMAAGITCGLAGVFWLYIFTGLLANVLAPRAYIAYQGGSPGDFTPIFTVGISLLWALALMAVLGSIAYGLEEAARRHFRKDAYV